MKTNLNISMSAETRNKIAESKREYHKRINDLLLLVNEIVKIQMDQSNTKKKKKII